MTKTVRARYHQGKLEPLEPLEIEEGAEVTVAVTSPEPSAAGTDPIAATAGAWKDLLDCEQLEKDIYESKYLPRSFRRARWSTNARFSRAGCWQVIKLDLSLHSVYLSCYGFIISQ